MKSSAVATSIIVARLSDDELARMVALLKEHVANSHHFDNWSAAEADDSLVPQEIDAGWQCLLIPASL